ncbi:NADH-quinone oxidoreductase subunit C [Chengkuizengella axinellae]|uniref:NADH-quinone oxidoreductase subunit C n=1 Tax=Chengkuizengella axinellae TaxID=3064388 RepID=A0ABT9J5E9_9BACL|nr:NADH-quinone oxidoreductase subunit C [Chengkuizengella sp. 2205SS18-9]MDP5276832.1 NADH-quinone oxidoreductase subunit C [Chengkuizengella sp. 2205SS18-9]
MSDQKQVTEMDPKESKKNIENIEEEVTEEPSPNQDRLDRIVELIKTNIAEDAIEVAFINELDRDLPCIVIRSPYWVKTAMLLKESELLKLNYLRNVSGIDFETHFEVVYYLLSMSTGNQLDVCIKVKADRENPSIPSITSVWNTANWNEREIYDLLGVQFPGHPNLKRIMMPDDWEGHPLRKDYEPIDPEV